MRAEYDFSTMEGRKNPYVRRLKKQVTIRLGEDVLAYFKSMAEEQGIPYQNLINLYLRDCMAQGRKLEWGELSTFSLPAPCMPWWRETRPRERSLLRS